MALNEYGKISRISLRDPKAAFGGQPRINAEWQRLNYHAQPDYECALGEYTAFVEALNVTDAEVLYLEGSNQLTLDAIYVRDAAIPSPRGLILANMGKPDRAEEPATNGAQLHKQGIDIAGTISGGGRVEGGDFVWLDDQTCAVGEGYRTNAEGIAQLKALLGPAVHVEVCPLPHYKGQDDVFHLMSMLSPLDRDLALVYSPLMPVPFRSWLLELGLQLVEVREHEFESMGCNVLAVSPRQCVMVEGNPDTRDALQAVGCTVTCYAGTEISRKGEGGPTCLTRPLEREN